MTVPGVTMQHYLKSSKDAAEELINVLNSLTFKSFCDVTTQEYIKVRYNAVIQAEETQDPYMIEIQKKIVKQISESQKLINESELSLHKEEYNSFSFVAESLLQIAKHGISVVHGSLNQCKSNLSGRTPSSIVKLTPPTYYFHEIIWAARNQAMHFDEIVTPARNNSEQHTHDVFNWLASLTKADFIEDIKFDPSIFSKFNSKEYNFAYQVVLALGWTSYEKFKSDMESIS